MEDRNKEFRNSCKYYFGTYPSDLEERLLSVELANMGKNKKQKTEAPKRPTVNEYKETIEEAIDELLGR